MSTTQIYLVRHGESIWNAEKRFQGQTNSELNEKGIQQAVKLAEFLKNKKIDVIYSSPLTRAKKTAEIIAQKLGKKILLDGRLMERCMGEWEGRKHKDVEKEQPEKYIKYREERSLAGVMSAEEFETFYRRVQASVNEIVRVNVGKSVVIVSHGGPIKVLLAKIREKELSHAAKIEQHNTAINLIDVKTENGQLKYVEKTVNDTQHLLDD